MTVGPHTATIGQAALLIAFSIAMSLVALSIFKLVSKPATVARARDRAIARVLELWLFRDDPVVCLGALGRVAAADLRYLGSLLLPMAASLVPVLAMLYLASRFLAYAPVGPGDELLLTQRWQSDSIPASFDPSSCGLEVLAGPVPCKELRETVWRVSPATQPSGAGSSQLGATSLRGRAPSSPATQHSGAAASPLGRDLFTGSRLPPDFSLSLPPANYNPFLRPAIDWLVALLVLSILAGLALKKPFKVEF